MWSPGLETSGTASALFSKQTGLSITAAAILKPCVDSCETLSSENKAVPLVRDLPVLVLTGTGAAPVALQQERGVGFFTRNDQIDPRKQFGRQNKTLEFLNTGDGNVEKPASWERAGDVCAGVARGARLHTPSRTVSAVVSLPRTRFSPSSDAKGSGPCGATR